MATSIGVLSNILKICRPPNGRHWGVISQRWLNQRELSGSARYLVSVTGQENLKPASNWGSKKQHRKLKLNFPLDTFDSNIEAVLAPLRAAVKEQVSVCQAAIER